ncbi:MAG: hypothetical protein JXA69_20640 [Phycisphaerae bacterium]|nr:hypothetical protein [Phycisphaerae bacterium]
MVATLKERLGTLVVSDPLDLGPLRIFGLRWEVPGELKYAVLDDAMAGKTIEVTEVSEGGSVPTLSVTNVGETMVFFMAGEHLIGAKQNRVLNVSLLVPEKSRATIPVSCVERGRWGYASQAFYGSGSSSHSYLRAKMTRQALKSYRTRGVAGSDQGEVWAEVDQKLHLMGSVSGSDALEQAYVDHAAKLDDVVQQARVPADCYGIVFAFDGRVAGVDLFDRPATLQKLMPKLVRGYAIDAIESDDGKPAPGKEDVERWLRAVGDATFERFDSPGIGSDVRIESKSLVGAGLVVDDRPVHVELFPADDPSDRPAKRTLQALLDAPASPPRQSESAPEAAQPSGRQRPSIWSRIWRRLGR